MGIQARAGCWSAAILLIGVVAQAQGITCPPAGKARLPDLTTDLGTYAVYVFRGKSSPIVFNGQELCKLDLTQANPEFIRAPAYVTHDRNGDHFFTAEFAREVYRLPASSYACEPPACPSTIAALRSVIPFAFNEQRPPFAILTFCGGPDAGRMVCQTGTSAWTIGAATSPGAMPSGDRIWVPQPGMYWVWPKVATVRVGTTIIPVTFLKNHSRLVAHDTSTGTTAVYNLPGDGNHVLSPVWDAGRNRLWFLEASLDYERPRVGWFNPNNLNPLAINATEDFLDPFKLDSIICRPPQVETACIGYFDLPIPGPNTIALGGDGLIWGAGSLSNQLFSLAPESGQIDAYPLQPGGIPIFGRAPNVGTPGTDGILYFGEYYTGMVGALDTATAPITPSCKVRSGGANPCVQYFDVPAAFEMQHGHQYDGVFFNTGAPFVDEANDVVWFGGGNSPFGPAPLAGYIERATGAIHFLPPIQDDVFRGLPNSGAERTLGLAPAANGRDLWGLDYIGGRIYLLKKLPM